MKRRSLIDFITKCSEQNPEFDFYNIKNSLEVQKLNDAINESGNIAEKANIIPSKFQSIRNGRRYGIECNIPKDNITNFHHFREDLNNWGFKISKHGKHAKISSMLNKKGE